MAKRKGGMGILPVVAIFLGLVAAGAGAGLFHFYNEFDRLVREEIPRLEGEVQQAKQAGQKAVDRWNELAPWVLAENIQKPEDFDNLDGRKVVDDQVVKLITAYFAKPAWGADEAARKDFARLDKLRIVNVIEDQAKKVESLEKQRGSALETVKQLQSDLKVATDSKEQVRRDLNTRLETLQRELGVKEHQLSETSQTLETRVAELNTQLEATRSVAKNDLQDRDKEISQLRNDRQRLQDQIKELTEVKQTKAVVTLESDGEVTGVDQRLGLAWINLGRQQRVERGMQFTVFTMGRGGVPREKGKVEVRNVEGDYSKVGILSQVDGQDPIVAGDQVANPVYHPRDTPEFVLCGEMERYSREDIIRLIEENGGRVKGQVQVGVHFLVVGGDRVQYENDPSYREALQLGIRVMTEQELLDYLPHYGDRR